MKRKCRWCQKVKTVKYRDSVNWYFFCSWECMAKACHINWLSHIACSRCNAPIRMNAIVVRRYNNSDTFYCCEKCMMEDLGIFEEGKQDGT